MRRLVGLLVERRKAVRDLCLLALALLLVLELLLGAHHGHFWFERTYGFWAFFGTVGAYLLARASKGAAHLFLGKAEDYYGGW